MQRNICDAGERGGYVKWNLGVARGIAKISCIHSIPTVRSTAFMCDAFSRRDLGEVLRSSRCSHY